MVKNKYYVLEEVVGKKIPMAGGKTVTLRANMSDREIQAIVKSGVDVSHFGETELGQKAGNQLESIRPNLQRKTAKISRVKAGKLAFPKQNVRVVERIVEKVVEGDSAKILNLATKLDNISKATLVFKKAAADYTANDIKDLKKATGLNTTDKQKLYDAIH